LHFLTRTIKRPLQLSHQISKFGFSAIPFSSIVRMP